MVVCRSFQLERHLALPQEDFPRPTWTRLVIDGLQVTNSIESAHWHTRPAELHVCEKCWDAGCAMSGLANVVRLGDSILLVPPTLDEVDEIWRSSLPPENLLSTLVIVSIPTWNEIKQHCNALPSASQFSLATRYDVFRAWLGEAPPGLGLKNAGDLDNVMGRLLASDPLDNSYAAHKIQNICEWMEAAPNAPVHATLHGIDQYRGQLNTLHFDGRPSPEWTAVAAEDGIRLVVGDQFVVVADTVEQHG